MRFAASIAQGRGRVTEGDIEAVKSAGYDDGQVIEIVLHVALNTWTNYLNVAAQTDIDFPIVRARDAV
jgi:alkylhydroperoxidase family enzyme